MAEPRPAGGPASYARLLAHLVSLNLQSAMEYRVSFLLHVLFMALNNLVYLAFWGIFFARFESVRGWRLPDVMVLFGVVATGFGIAHVLCGGMREISRAIAEGSLDVPLGQPKDPLFKLLAARSQASALGDLASGILLFAGYGPGGAGPWVGFLLGSVGSALVLTAFTTAVESAAFWLGASRALSRLAQEGLLSLSMYPEPLFEGPLKPLLYTVIPAGLFAFVPAGLARAPSLAGLVGFLGLAVLLMAAAWALFHRGLRRYESGSQMVISA